MTDLIEAPDVIDDMARRFVADLDVRCRVWHSVNDGWQPRPLPDPRRPGRAQPPAPSPLAAPRPPRVEQRRPAPSLPGAGHHLIDDILAVSTVAVVVVTFTQLARGGW